MKYKDLNLTYEEDILTDNIFHDAKKISFAYLQNIDSSIDDNSVKIAYNFICTKYEELSNLKKAMKTKYYVRPFREIAESLDKITITNQLSMNEQENILVLTKDLSYALEDLYTHYLIINKMMHERNLISSEMS